MEQKLRKIEELLENKCDVDLKTLIIAITKYDSMYRAMPDIILLFEKHNYQLKYKDFNYKIVKKICKEIKYDAVQYGSKHRLYLLLEIYFSDINDFDKIIYGIWCLDIKYLKNHETLLRKNCDKIKIETTYVGGKLRILLYEKTRDDYDGKYEILKMSNLFDREWIDTKFKKYCYLELMFYLSN